MEVVNYYFADFVRKGGGGGTPQIPNSPFAENFVRKGGGGGTPHIRNLFFGQKTPFLALFKENFSGECP